LISIFQDELDTTDKIRVHLDKRACWDQHKEEHIDSLYDIADSSLALNRKKRPERVKLVPELEDVRHGTEALKALKSERDVGPLLKAQEAEKECCICLKAEVVGKFLTLVRSHTRAW
jgi:hypothetical protein